MTPRLHPRLALGVAAVAVTAAGAAVAPSVAAASEHPILPAITAAQLLTEVRTASVRAFSGTVVETARLGLPELPGRAGIDLSWQSLVTGTHVARVWVAGPDQQRVAMVGQLAESDLVHNGRDLWSYNSDSLRVGHTLLPASQHAAEPTAPAPPAPANVAKELLAAVNPSTVVTVDPTTRVAGRPAYTLALAPRDSRSTIRSVRIAVDAQRHVPLRVQVFGSAARPAFELGFSSVSFRTPAAAVFQFRVPRGATVTGPALAAPGPRAVAAAPMAGRMPPGLTAPGAPAAPAGGRPQLLGSGWTTVVELPSFPLAAALPGGRLLARSAVTLAGRQPAAAHRLGESARAARRAGVRGRCHRCRPPAGSRQQVTAPPAAARPDSAAVPAVVRTAGLTRRFGAQVAVNEVDLEVPAGAVYAFLGPNGSGKTTTIRMLLGLIRPHAGRITLLGQSMPAALARVLPRVGALVEGPAFHPYLSGTANLRRLDRCDATADPATSHRRIETALARVGLTAAAGKRYRGYSLGMKQRLGLAAALLQPRDLLVLDEPTNGLDPQGTREVRHLVRELAADGTTVLVSSHLLLEVQQVATHVGIMSGGRLLRQGPLEEVLATRDAVVRIGTPDTAAVAAVLTKLRLAGVRIDDERHQVTALLGDIEPDRVAVAVVRAKARLRSLSVDRPDLEELFVSLTGEGFDVAG